MKKIINKLFCLHKWKTYTKVDRKIDDEYVEDQEVTCIILICEHCGKIKELFV